MKHHVRQILKSYMAKSVCIGLGLSALPHAGYGQYCTPSSTLCGYGDAITNVTFAGVNNTTTCSTNGYGNYTASVAAATASAGTTYPISVKIENGGTEHASVWVDFNQNQAFEANEFFYLGSSTNGNAITGNIPVPATAVSGATRIRIRGSYGPTAPTASAACNFTSSSFGETEDYTVNISNGVPPPTCFAPAMPTATAITTTTASLNWTQAGTPSQWQIKYGATGFPLATGGTNILTPTKPYTLNPPLTPGTTYDYYVRAICGAGDTSAWSPVATFTTTCIPPTISSKTDSFRCGPGTVVLKATPSAGSIKWYTALTGGTAVFTGNTYTTPSLTATTTYYITAATGTCESTPRQAVTATIRPLPVVNIGNDTTICPGTSYTMNAGNAGATYLWNNNATTQSITVNQAGNYSVLVTLNGCSNSDARLITDGEIPVRNLPATIDLCQGQVANLNAGNAGSTYLWTPGGQTTQTVNIGTGGIHAVTIKSTTGCVIRDSTLVVMRQLPVVDLGNDTTVCIGAPVTIDAGASSHKYLWTPTGDTTQTITVSDSGTYRLRVTTAFSCVDSFDRHIAWLPAVHTSGFNFIPLFYEDLGKVRFEPIDPISVTSYLWDFGDGSATTTEERPVHTYSTTGQYIVTLLVSGGCGTDTTRLPIHVDLATGIAGPGQAEESLLLYPNPAHDRLTLECRNPDLRPSGLVIYNTLGAAVYRREIHHLKEQVNTRVLAAGSYVIRIQTNRGSITRKFEVAR
ncbi:GEVED domain-containing protein [Taibaiella chishuiensis]|uniref:Putative secreted protein (Por secretion system target) n=1 Tax=Taibaiella chishuiensis TaxID=1434707 RepID=A0A2P8D347_9BACT|nr:GEVED domain-containing protein [Taibaiella chishuiensis]PSK91647.1 putative secreted protein (Por secretion system target) [Taibaiella chishuiensis]